MHPGKTLILVGLLIAGGGLLWLLLGKLPFFGRLPGDIYVERPHFKFYFPLGSCLLISLLLSLLFWLFRR
jgi:Protein of unknown function (DUF2905)